MTGYERFGSCVVKAVERRQLLWQEYQMLKSQAGVGRFRNCIIKTVKMKQLQQQDELIQIAFKTYVSLSFFWGMWHKLLFIPPMWVANLNEENIWWVCLINNCNYICEPGWRPSKCVILFSVYFLSFSKFLLT